MFCGACSIRMRQVWGLSISAATRRPTGTVYPLLVRLEQASLVTSDWEVANDRPGPRRRLYSLTPAGGEWADRLCGAKTVVRRGQPATRVVVA